MKKKLEKEVLSIDVAESLNRVRIREFYKKENYHGEPQEKDVVVYVETSGVIIGATWLTTEEGINLLRGMKVNQKFQRRGIGRKLLEAVTKELEDKECFCIPYQHPHLLKFYQAGGFEIQDLNNVPEFLALRVKKFQKRNDGKDYTVMKRMQKGEGKTGN